MAMFMDVSGQWDIVQDNGYRVRIYVQQTDDQISATASHSSGRVLSRAATGFVQGPDLTITIDWKDGTRGQYTGTFTREHFPPPNGLLRGHTRDLNNPGSSASWYSEGRVFQYA